MKIRLSIAVLVLSLFVSLVGGVMAQDGTIVEVASGSADFSTLVSLVESAGLVETLSGEGPFIVFAPSNEAFAALPAPVLEYLGAHPEVLTQVLSYHVVAGAELADGEVATVEGGTVVVEDMMAVVDGANVTSTIEASNGTIYVVDGVLLPEIVLPAADPLDFSAGSIVTAGSSTVFPLAERIGEVWSNAGGIAPSIDSIGSGAGIERFCVAGETDIANSSRGIRDSEIESCVAIGRNPIEFRVGTDALAVVTSAANDFATDATLPELALIFGSATNWSDVRAEWPAEAIQRFIPGTDSGTFDYFVEAVFVSLYEAIEEGEVELTLPYTAEDFVYAETGESYVDALAAAEEAGDEELIGAIEDARDAAIVRPILSASNLQFSEDDNVLVQGVEGSPYAVAFFGYAYFAAEGDALKALAVDGVEPNGVSAEDGSYPLARPLYIYSDASILTEKPEVAAFINYFLTNVNNEIVEVGYFPASAGALNLARLNWLAATGN